MVVLVHVAFIPYCATHIDEFQYLNLLTMFNVTIHLTCLLGSNLLIRITCAGAS